MVQYVYIYIYHYIISLSLSYSLSLLEVLDAANVQSKKDKARGFNKTSVTLKRVDILHT